MLAHAAWKPALVCSTATPGAGRGGAVRRPARFPASTRKTFTHPVAGRFTVECDVFSVSDGDLRMVVWTATPGTQNARALELLGRAPALGATLVAAARSTTAWPSRGERAAPLA